jgi:transposase
MSRFATLTDAQWAQIAPLLPGKSSDPGHTARDSRLFIDAVLWINRTGSPWRDLPGHFGRWNTVYKRFARFDVRGVWWKIFKALQRTGNPIELLLDGSIVRAHQHSAGASKKKALRRLEGQEVA